AYCRERGLPWREDASNAASKRGATRERLLPALRELHPAAEQNILRTLALLRDEAAVLDAALAEPPTTLAELAALPRPLARLAIRRLADRAAGGEAPLLAGAEMAGGEAAAGGEPAVGGETAVGGEAAVGGEPAVGGEAAVVGETEVGGEAAVGGETPVGGEP